MITPPCGTCDCPDLLWKKPRCKQTTSMLLLQNEKSNHYRCMRHRVVHKTSMLFASATKSCYIYAPSLSAYNYHVFAAKSTSFHKTIQDSLPAINNERLMHPSVVHTTIMVCLCNKIMTFMHQASVHKPIMVLLPTQPHCNNYE